VGGGRKSEDVKAGKGKKKGSSVFVRRKKKGRKACPFDHNDGGNPKVSRKNGRSQERGRKGVTPGFAKSDLRLKRKMPPLTGEKEHRDPEGGLGHPA